ncbi:uncharacterized protein [Henckelia pumila]|uniref:uncharacterized protein isoform X2 n=1 Tax=Henckelia pumila TaxID=405737 RepID=UPI003C6E03E2
MLRTQVFLAQALFSLALISFVKNFRVLSVWRYVMNLVPHLVDTESESFTFRIWLFLQTMFALFSWKMWEEMPKVQATYQHQLEVLHREHSSVEYNSAPISKEVEARKAVTTSDTTTKATREESSPARTINHSIRNTIRALNNPEIDVTDSDRKSLRRLRSRSSRISGTSDRGETSLRRSDFGLCLIMGIFGCFMFEIQVIWEEMTILGPWDFPFAFLSLIR